jgi:glycerophosphoryl diester phosphodiesterase
VTLAIAHRGEPVGHRENTPAAFAAALRAGADMIELDCRLTADGFVVVVHDATLGRLWDRPVAVSDLSAAEVGALGSGDCRVPLLTEVLSDVSAPIMVDVADPAVMPAALRDVGGLQALQRCVFAGNLDGLRWLRAESAGARIALTWNEQRPPDEGLVDELRPELFNPRFDLLEEPVIDWMHRAGIAVSAWTVDDDDVMARLVALGVDAIITNRVGALVALLHGTRGGAP